MSGSCVPCQPRQPSPAEGEEQGGGENRQGKDTQNTEPSHSTREKGFFFSTRSNQNSINISFQLLCIKTLMSPHPLCYASEVDFIVQCRDSVPVGQFCRKNR